MTPVCTCLIVLMSLATAPDPLLPPAPGQPTPPAHRFRPRDEERLTLAAAIALAEAHARGVRAAAESAEAGVQGRRRAEGANWPALTASGDASRGPVSGSAGAGLTLSYDVDTAGARHAGVSLARAQERQAALALLQARQQLRLDVALAYYDAQEAEEQVRIERLEVETSQTSLRDAQALQKAGEATVFDLQRATVQLAGARQRLADAERQRVVARRRLVRVVGLDPAAAPVPAAPVERSGRWGLPLAEAIALGLRHRPEPELVLLDREVARQQGWLGWAGLLPRTQLFATGNTQQAALFDGFTPVPLPGQTASYGATVGARVSWPLFDGGAAWAGADQAAAQARAAEIRYADTLAAIQYEIEEADAALRNADAKIMSADEALVAARAGLASARKRFTGGVGVQTDVLLAQQDLIRAEGDRVRAVLGYNRALAALRRATLRD